MNKEISMIIKNIKKKNIDYRDIPVELRDNTDIIQAERKSGMRVYSYRGYDVIFNRFFVEEDIIDFSDNSILRTIPTTFESFDDYYQFLNGNIYEKSCYYQYQFTQKQIKEYKIDVSKFTNKAFISTTIEEDNFSNELSIIDEEYKISELKKEKNKQWFNKVLDCKNYIELKKVLENFEKSKYHEYYFESILKYHLIKNNPKKAFKIFMDSINNGEDLIRKEKMCLYFSPQEVLNTINYKKNVRASSTISRYMKQIRNFASNIENNNYTKEIKCWFEIGTNFYIIEEAYKINGENWPVTIRKYFYDIKELKEYLHNDLSNWDLSKAVINEEDIKEEHHIDTKGLIRGIETNNLDDIVKNMSNLLELFTLKKYPVVYNTKKRIEELGNADKVLMSGSGPTVFALYFNEEKLEDDYKILRLENEETFITETVI